MRKRILKFSSNKNADLFCRYYSAERFNLQITEIRQNRSKVICRCDEIIAKQAKAFFNASFVLPKAL